MPPNLINEIDNHLRLKLDPLRLEIIDESGPHSLRSTVKEINDTPTHLLIVIEAVAFKGLKLLEQHRLVYECFKGYDNLMPHALRLKTICPDSN